MIEHPAPLDRTDLARLVAGDIPPDSYVNLGIGQPAAVADHLDPADGVVLHTENGMLGMGPHAHGDDVDPDLLNAGKTPVTELPGASYFDHAQSFAMMRGGHLDVMMTLFDKTGAPKLVPECTYPITGLRCVRRVYTDLAVFHLTENGVVVTATYGTTLAELSARLEVPLTPGP
jgi:3-oxoadipate CoA-transferase beta subunit